jgi:class 3 adenylate cyclase
MFFWTELRVPTEHELLIGFYDLTGYMRYADKAEPRPLLDLMAGYFHLTGQILADAGGRLIKAMGDAGLAAFPAELVDAGVLAFQSLQRQGDAWLAGQGYKTHAVVKLHLGPVAIGMVGGPGLEIVDVYGLTVNTAAQLPSTGLAMTPTVFRRLAPATRQLFKKHTPPVSYICVEDSRPRQRAS